MLQNVVNILQSDIPEHPPHKLRKDALKDGQERIYDKMDRKCRVQGGEDS